MTNTKIKPACQFQPEALQFKRFLNPIIDCLIRQAEALEYSIWRVRDSQKIYPVSFWNIMKRLAIAQGWNVTPVYHNNEQELLLFHQATSDFLVIYKHLGEDLSLEPDEEKRLADALQASGFNLAQEDEHSLLFERTAPSLIPTGTRSESAHWKNPFPEALTFLKSEQVKTSWLKHFAKLIEEQGEEHGYVVEFFNSNQGNDQLALAEPALREAGWQITKVMKNEDLDFVLLLPSALGQIDIRTRWYGKISLNQDEQDRLIKAMKQHHYQLTERDAHYLSFAQDTSAATDISITASEYLRTLLDCA